MKQLFITLTFIPFLFVYAIITDQEKAQEMSETVTQLMMKHANEMSSEDETP